jgi:hypothetical protein
MWFAALAFFHFPFFGDILIFPLNGCAMLWVIVFLVSRATTDHRSFGIQNSINKRIWYSGLILFALLSWTQIRLTASSLSPDFIAAISILLAFYFFSGNRDLGESKNSDLIAVFFSAVAVSIKLSAIPVLLIPCIMAGFWLTRRKYLNVVRVGLMLILILTPIVIRNIISTGYPVYPSAAADFFRTDWKVEKATVLDFQKYITAYARYPVCRSQSPDEYNKSLMDWLPLWWNHLYIVDRTLIMIVIAGVLLNAFFFRKTRHLYSTRQSAGFVIAMIGTGFWFINAPDPRFGTGFIIALVYFLYLPFVDYWAKRRFELIKKAQNGMVKIASLLTLIYVGYRGVYFFQPKQLIFPEGIKKISPPLDDCDTKIKKMVLDDTFSPGQLPDSCMFFRFRGTTVKQGFKPAR